MAIMNRRKCFTTCASGEPNVRATIANSTGRGGTYAAALQGPILFQLTVLNRGKHTENIEDGNRVGRVILISTAWSWHECDFCLGYRLMGTGIAELNGHPDNLSSMQSSDSGVALETDTQW